MLVVHAMLDCQKKKKKKLQNKMVRYTLDLSPLHVIDYKVFTAENIADTA